MYYLSLILVGGTLAFLVVSLIHFRAVSKFTRGQILLAALGIIGIAGIGLPILFLFGIFLEPQLLAPEAQMNKEQFLNIMIVFDLALAGLIGSFIISATQKTERYRHYT